MHSSRRGRRGKTESKQSRKGSRANYMLRNAAQARKTSRSGYSGALNAVYAAGFADAVALFRSGGELPGQEAKLRMNEHWSRRCLTGWSAPRGANALLRGKAYADGFAVGMRQPKGTWVPVALTGSAAAIVLAGSGTRSEAIKQLLRLPLQEIIVVLEDGGEHAFAQLRALPEITIVHTRERLGMDVGRTVGARMTHADLILFADGEVEVAAERLAAMLEETQAGSDLVLANVSGQLGVFRSWDDAARIRAFMNWSLGQPQLNANSVAVLPHVWTRRGLDSVGLPQLAVPPMAHQAAIEHNLHIRCCPVSTVKNGAADRGIGGGSAASAAKLSAGDHIEALRAAMHAKGARLSLPDQARRRLAVEGGLK